MRWSKVISWTFLSCLAFVNAVVGQDSTQVWEDKVLTYNEYISIVKEYHPMARQAALLSDQAKARMRSARGFFDPVLYSKVDQKIFKEKDYYRLSESGLKIPTWFGLEGKIAYEWNDGEYLNPQYSVPEDGLSIVGVSWDLGGGIFLDERRAMLQQAKLFRQSGEAAQIQLLNDLLLDANTAYWDWVAAYENAKVLDSALALSQIRFEGVKQGFQQGDKAAIDTLEAFIKVQNRQITQFEGQQKLIEKSLKVSNFLWFENSIPLQLEPEVTPENFREDMIDLAMLDTLSNELNQLQQTHPLLRQYQFKIEEERINQRLKSRYLVPTVKLNYNFITDQGPFQGTDLEQTGFSTQDYKFGVDVKLPLLLREGRGNWQEARIKREKAELKLDQKTLEVVNKAKTYQNKLSAIHQQLLIYRSAVINYQRMLDAEVTKFFNGESSIFLINSRELKLIEAQVKLNKTEADYEKTKANFYHALGTLSQQ